MTISVLMPTLANPGWDKYLHTILAQSVPPDEIIVIVDQPVSDKHRTQMAEKWPQVTFLFNPKNIGIAAALNLGLAQANGEYIFRVDDDDHSRHDRIEKQLRCFEILGVDLVGSWAKSEHDNSRSSYVIKNPSSHQAIAKALLSRNIMIHPSLAFRKEAILKIGGYDENFIYAQDYALYLRALRVGLTFANVPEPLVSRGYPDGSITVRHRHQQLMFSCAARILDAAHRNDRGGFVRTISQYTLLVLTPNWIRRLRRKIFLAMGTGK